MERFSASELEQRLAGVTIGSRIHFLESTDSTNTVALDRANAGAAEGEVVIADQQLQGRGRVAGRRWQSPPGRNLYASVILRPPLRPEKAASITLMTGVAVAEVLDRFCPGRVTLKWPNDVLIDGKKVSGVLTEMRMKDNKIDCVIVGIGVNILMERDEFDPLLRNQATSILEAARELPDRVEVTTDILRSLDFWYSLLIERGFAPVRERWTQFAAVTGKQVIVENRGARESGLVLGIDEDGTLLLENEEGGVTRVLSGDVTIQ